MADARAWRDDAEGLEGLRRPAEDRVALAVALVLALEVALVDVARAEEVGLDRVVDDEVDRDERLDLRRVLARALHRRPHRREIDGGRNPGVVLKEDPSGAEWDRDVVPRIPGERLSCLPLRVAVNARHPLEQDLDRDRQCTT